MVIFKIICFFGVFLLINHNVHGILCWSAEARGPGQRHWGDQAFQGFKGSKAPRCAQRCPSSDPQKAIYIKGNERLLCLFVFSICFYLLSSFMFCFYWIVIGFDQRTGFDVSCFIVIIFFILLLYLWLV